MKPLYIMLVLLILAGCTVLGTGCVSLPELENPVTDASMETPPSVAQYKVTLVQPEGWSAFFKMDADVYNPGEVVEFFIRNDGSRTLDCSGDPPSFSIRYQQGNGTWATQYRPALENTGQISHLRPGESTGVYRFATTGWEPNRYRILSDCRISRDILIRTRPAIVPTVCPQAGNGTLWIRVDPIVNHMIDGNLSLSGTTNLAAGEELPYSLFSLNPDAKNITMVEELSSSTVVHEGICGINTWSVDIKITSPNEYFLGISDITKKVTGLRRFTIYASE